MCIEFTANMLIGKLLIHQDRFSTNSKCIKIKNNNKTQFYFKYGIEA